MRMGQTILVVQRIGTDGYRRGKRFYRNREKIALPIIPGEGEEGGGVRPSFKTGPGQQLALEHVLDASVRVKGRRGHASGALRICAKMGV